MWDPPGGALVWLGQVGASPQRKERSACLKWILSPPFPCPCARNPNKWKEKDEPGRSQWRQSFIRKLLAPLRLGSHKILLSYWKQVTTFQQQLPSCEEPPAFSGASPWEWGRLHQDTSFDILWHYAMHPSPCIIIEMQFRSCLCLALKLNDKTFEIAPREQTDSYQPSFSTGLKSLAKLRWKHFILPLFNLLSVSFSEFRWRNKISWRAGVVQQPVESYFSFFTLFLQSFVWMFASCLAFRLSFQFSPCETFPVPLIV